MEVKLARPTGQPTAAVQEDDGWVWFTGKLCGGEKTGLQIVALTAVNDECAVEGEVLGYIGVFAI